MPLKWLSAVKRFQTLLSAISLCCLSPHNRPNTQLQGSKAHAGKYSLQFTEARGDTLTEIHMHTHPHKAYSAWVLHIDKEAIKVIRFQSCVRIDAYLLTGLPVCLHLCLSHRWHWELPYPSKFLGRPPQRIWSTVLSVSNVIANFRTLSFTFSSRCADHL